MCDLKPCELAHCLRAFIGPYSHQVEHSTMHSHSARQLADDLWLLDTLYQDEPGVVASYLLTGPEGAALVDVGSAATIKHLLAAMRAARVEPRDIRHIVLTHIHLDHAGAAGAL